MKRNLIQKVQAVLLLATLAVVGTALIPATADAAPPCDPGNTGCFELGANFCFTTEYRGEWISCYEGVGGVTCI